ncbi:MAG: cation transporter [Tepidiphilus sp.]|nr:cation transporter [Tepidiphilus sp.]
MAEQASIPPSPAATARARGNAIARTSLAAMAVNATLALLQIVIGLLANAFSLVADAMHTLADLSTDAMVSWAGRSAGAPPDAEHPYGHGRFETLASFILGLVLLGVGCGFLWAAGMKLQTLEHAPPIEIPALVMAVITLLAKEGMFHWLYRRGRALKAKVLEAAAWHARSDAASSLVVAIGIGGSLAGYRFLEPLAAALVGFMIASMGVRFAYRAVRELVDTGLEPEEVARLTETIRTTPGVEDLHQIRTRRMADRILVDAHIQVAPRLSVSEGHRVADTVFARLKARFPNLDDALIHVDHENDTTRPPGQLQALTDRTEVVQDLRALPAFAAASPDWIVLHYLGGRTYLDLLVPAEHAPSLLAADRAALFSQLDALRQRHPDLASLRLFVELAPEPGTGSEKLHQISANEVPPPPPPAGNASL